MGPLRRSILLLCALAGAGCGDSTGPGGFRIPNFIDLRSETGDNVGRGRSYSYDQRNAIITVTAEGSQLNVEVHGDERWSGVFRDPANIGRLSKGSYTNLQRFRIQAPTAGGLSWTERDRPCDALTGSVSPLLVLISFCTACLGVAGLVYELRAHRRHHRDHAEATYLE